MKSVISTRDIEELLRTGGGVQSLPDDAILTPSARDLLRDLESAAPRAPNGAAARTAPPPPLLSPPAAPVSAAAAPKPAPSPPAPGQSPNSQSPKPEIEAFFHSSYCHELKLQICDIGRRLWKRAYVDGNGGNIAIRVGDDLVLCTPTLVSKGFMKPEDMCLVDFEGNQVLGAKKRTSEILMHLQMMRAQPMDIASVHCHPPYATAFAVAGVLPPTCMIPEYEVFASVAIAPYRTPGTPEMGKLVAELVGQHNTILMANHGVVTWSHNNVEEAYWRMEIIEAYCRTLTVAAQLGQPMKTFSPEQMKDLLAIKKNLGFVDPRYGLKECELCDNA
ncbi:MAG: class II aldolase/adducin family protein, partial [Verrucomicrobia bacterium]|nr:class II aldolase/adducin family protein [Verrucomicrobiota bacterium]